MSTSQDFALSLGDCSFNITKKSPKLVNMRSSAFVEEEKSFPTHHAIKTQRMPIAPFASITMQNSVDSKSSTGATIGGQVPLFMIASATEVKQQKVDVNAPAWRTTLGHIGAGAVAGCAVEAALYPIDTIKTRLQAMIGGGGIKALLQQGGGKALYAGIWGNLAGVAPSSAIFMGVYEPVKQWVYKNTTEEQQFLGPVIAGMAAGTAASFTRVPTEVIKQRLQTKEFAGPISAIRSIVAKEGLRGLYAGYGAFLLRDLPFDAIEFVAYEQVKIALSKSLGRDLNPGETSLVGAFAGGFTGVITTPLDVLKTRLMTQGSSGKYKNTFDCLSQIVRHEGMGALMSGWQPRLIWISLGGFVFFPVLEAAKGYFAPKIDVVPLEVPPTKPCCGGSKSK